MTPTLTPPYPYFGGKTAIAAFVWTLLGDVPHFIDPFFGGGSIVLRRPGYHAARHREVVNDIWGFIPNFWRAVAADQEAVATAADWPNTECDLHARHAWLVGHQDALQARLEGDPYYYDVTIAGWWVWGMAQWIGSEFCSGEGPWQVVDGQLLHLGGNGQGVARKRLHLGNNGQGVARKLLHLGDNGRGVARQRLHLGGNGQGVARQGLHLGDNGLRDYMHALADRMRRVWVCCGDWTRVLGPSVTFTHGLTGIFLDPPYGTAMGREIVYTHDSGSVAQAVQQWCAKNGSHPLLRIVLCGYDTEHDALLGAGWRKETWTTHGGYGTQSHGRGRANRTREALWISPHCLRPAQLGLFERQKEDT